MSPPLTVVEKAVCKALFSAVDTLAPPLAVAKTKDGEMVWVSPVSTSVKAMVPEVSSAESSDSVSAVSPPAVMTGASLVPVMVMVTTWLALALVLASSDSVTV